MSILERASIPHTQLTLPVAEFSNIADGHDGFTSGASHNFGILASFAGEVPLEYEVERTGFEKVTAYSIRGEDGRIKGVVSHFFEDTEVKTILISGFTKEGYVACPFVCYVKDEEKISVLEVNWKKVPWADREVCLEPWKPVLKDGKPIRNRLIEAFEIPGSILSDNNLLPESNTSSQVSVERANELFARWGIEPPFEVEAF